MFSHLLAGLCGEWMHSECDSHGQLTIVNRNIIKGSERASKGRKKLALLCASERV